jgi:hypothetical protein
MPLAPRQLVRAGRSHRGQHNRHTGSLQCLEQDPPPIPRSHNAADLARPPLARLTAPPARTPLPWLARLRRDTVTPVHRRPHLADCAEIHATARAANAGRRLRTALDTNRTLPNSSIRSARISRLTPDRRRRNPLLIAVVPGQRRPPRNHPHLAASWGRRFEPGRSTRARARFRGSGIPPLGSSPSAGHIPEAGRSAPRRARFSHGPATDRCGTHDELLCCNAGHASACTLGQPSVCSRGATRSFDPAGSATAVASLSPGGEDVLQFHEPIWQLG